MRKPVSKFELNLINFILENQYNIKADILDFEFVEDLGYMIDGYNIIIDKLKFSYKITILEFKDEDLIEIDVLEFDI